MSEIDRKLYQLIISRLDGERLSSEAYEEQAFKLVQKGIGGFILFGGKKEEVRGFTDMLQSVSDTPLFIASDIERGVGQQVDGASYFPCQMAVAAAINRDRPEEVDVLEGMINSICNESIDIGINMPLIPVLDVNSNHENPIICTRAFSDDPEDVAWYGSFYIRVLERSGLISCAKHFPGHGDTAIDSHISLPVIKKPVDRLMDTDIHPFKRAIEAGASSVMIGHLTIPDMDHLPASLSKKIVTDLLRNELGFKGLIMTDALNMDALKEIDNAAVKSLDAGVDILLHPADPDHTVEELKNAIGSGILKESTVDTALERILKYKENLKSIKRQIYHCDKCKELSEIIFEDSITLVKESADLLPLRSDDEISVVIVGDDEDHDFTPLENIIPAGSDIIKVGEGNKKSFALEAELNDIVVFALFTDVAAWKGSSGIGEEHRKIIDGLIDRAVRSIVISFGSPYVLEHFGSADVLIAAYDSNVHAQSAVINCLTSNRSFHGSLPVNLFSSRESPT